MFRHSAFSNLPRLVFVAVIASSIIAGHAEDVEQATTGESKPTPPPSIEVFKKNKAIFSGFFTAYWDAVQGGLYIEVPEQTDDFIYVSTLASGVGTTDLDYDLDTFGGPLDRGMTGPTELVSFDDSGPGCCLSNGTRTF
jgi:hypothetical protein